MSEKMEDKNTGLDEKLSDLPEDWDQYKDLAIEEPSEKVYDQLETPEVKKSAAPVKAASEKKSGKIVLLALMIFLDTGIILGVSLRDKIEDRRTATTIEAVFTGLSAHKRPGLSHQPAGVRPNLTEVDIGAEPKPHGEATHGEEAVKSEGHGEQAKTEGHGEQAKSEGHGEQATAKIDTHGKPEGEAKAETHGAAKAPEQHEAAKTADKPVEHKEAKPAEHKDAKTAEPAKAQAHADEKAKPNAPAKEQPKAAKAEETQKPKEAKPQVSAQKTHAVAIGLFRSYPNVVDSEKKLEVIGVPSFKKVKSKAAEGFLLSASTPGDKEKASALNALKAGGFFGESKESSVVSSFYFENEAQLAKKALEKTGLQVKIDKFKGNLPLWLVYAGPMGETEAKEALAKIKAAGMGDSVIVKYGP